jgi:type II secretory pathway pseudopilin PulG
MGSVTCNRCGFVSFATSEVCKQCGATLAGAQQQEGAHNWQAQPGAGWQAPGNANWQAPSDANWQGAPQPYAVKDDTPKRKGLAVVALLCGLLAVPTMLVGAIASIWLGAAAAFVGVGLGLAAMILALVLGIAGVARANNRPAEFGGRGAAIAGIVLGGLSLVGIVPIGIVTAIAVPNLMASRRAANEGSAIRAVRLLAEAESHYQSTVGAGSFGTLDELSRADLIDAQLSSGVLHGYRFEVEASSDSFEVTATPTDYPNTGTRSFYYSSEDQVLRAFDKRGQSADQNDPPLPDSVRAGAPSRRNDEPDVDWTDSGSMMREATRQRR